jgi:hypothetical protein
MSDFDVLLLLLGFAVLGAGVLFVLKFINSKLHHEPSPYGGPANDSWMDAKGPGDGDSSATGA